jgi:alpha-ribazole phosphatase/probable phosphoglycerate mutase
MKRLSRIYLVRHGQINGYEKIPVVGHTDVDLTETGILQMEQIAERLRLVEIKAIYASDLKRSATGARLISRSHDVPVHFLPELREMYFGDWEGLTLTQIQDRYPEELKKRQNDLVQYEIPGDGESIGHFSERILQCFEGILAEQKHNDFVMVTHSGVNRVILCKALGLNLSQLFNIHQGYGCLNIIDTFPDSALVRLMNG